MLRFKEKLGVVISIIGFVLLVALLGTPFLFRNSSSETDYHTSHAGITTALLPGDQLWNDGAHAFDFGTNDTIRWSQINAGNDPTIAAALKSAGFGLLRTWFFAGTTDADIDNRIQVFQESGTVCLGVLPDYTDLAYNSHIIAYLGNKCNIYEFGNEPDNDMGAYIQAWNTYIPQLHKINPNAKFIGPAVASSANLPQFVSAVKSSGVLPDAITFHLYPCKSNDSSSRCLNRVSIFSQVISRVRAWVDSSLGPKVPVGITEWNYNGAKTLPPYGSDPAFITHFTNGAMNAMIQSHLDFACQFDLANGGPLDMFDVEHNNGQPKSQFYAMKALIDRYKPETTSLPIPLIA